MKNNEEPGMEKKSYWIQGAVKKPGALRKDLKVKKGNKIPLSKLKEAAKKKGKMGKRARLAMTFREMVRRGR